MFNPHCSLQASEVKSRGNSMRYSAAFSATRTATAAPEDRNRINSKRAMVSSSLEGHSPKHKNSLPLGRAGPMSPGNATTALSKPSFLQDSQSRDIEAVQTRCDGGDEIYLRVMDGEDQREKKSIRDQLRTAQESKRKERGGRQCRKSIEGVRISHE